MLRLCEPWGQRVGGALPLDVVTESGAPLPAVMETVTSEVTVLTGGLPIPGLGPRTCQPDRRLLCVSHDVPARLPTSPR